MIFQCCGKIVHVFQCCGFIFNVNSVDNINLPQFQEVCNSEDVLKRSYLIGIGCGIYLKLLIKKHVRLCLYLTLRYLLKQNTATYLKYYTPKSFSFLV